jgi:voltage-gated potassium channel
MMKVDMAHVERPSLLKAVPSGYRVVTEALLVVFILVMGGAVGYMWVEKWSFFDSLYMSVITLTSVGYLEVHPLSTEGRAFTMGLLLTGVFSLFYAAQSAIRAIVGGELTGELDRSRMEKKLLTLTDHVIICGFGRMGRLVAQEFSLQKIPFVIIERNGDLLADFSAEHGVALTGDATHDETLRRAGIDRARTLVTLAASDADNLFITMSARLMSDRIFIVARAEDEGAERKLTRAGANRVISPYVIGGQRVAQAVLRPSVVDFIELATRSDYMALQIEETVVHKTSALCGQPLRDTGLRHDLGLIVVAIKRPDGRMVFNPAPEAVIVEGDILITLGPKAQQDQLRVLAT